MPPPEPETTPAPRPAGWWLRVERVWLDPIAEPLDERAAAAGWAPDAPGGFCDRCGGSIGAHEADEFGCARCRGRRLPWARCVRLGEYAPPLSDWIAEVKFTRWRALGLALGHRLGEAVRRAAGRPLDPEHLAVVPVPMSLRRRLSRGIDHAHVLATGVATELHAPLLAALWRKHRPSQRAVPPSSRQANVAGSIFPRRRSVLGRPIDLRGRLALLVDDVTTSGATLRAAARALRAARSAPAEIWACVGAVAPDPDRRLPRMESGWGVDDPSAEGG